jgi:hypothetical protein
MLLANRPVQFVTLVLDGSFKGVWGRKYGRCQSAGLAAVLPSPRAAYSAANSGAG